MVLTFQIVLIVIIIFSFFTSIEKNEHEKALKATSICIASIIAYTVTLYTL